MEPLDRPLRRREFCKKLSGFVITAGIASYSLDSCSNNNPVGPRSENVTVNVDITQPANAPLQSIGGSIYVANPKDSTNDIIVYRASATQVNAFSSRCTHAGFKVSTVVNGQAVCPLHGAVFNTKGEVVSGPAPGNLPPYQAEISGTIITILV